MKSEGTQVVTVDPETGEFVVNFPPDFEEELIKALNDPSHTPKYTLVIPEK